MSLITRTVTNLTTKDIQLFVPGYNMNNQQVIVPASATVDLFTLLTGDELEAMQSLLTQYVNAGYFTVVATVDTTTFNPVGGGSGSANPGGSIQLSDGSGGFIASTYITDYQNGLLGIGPNGALTFAGANGNQKESLITFTDNTNQGLENTFVTLRGDNNFGGTFTVQTGGGLLNNFVLKGDGTLNLPPLTTVQINATSPSEGAVAYDSTLHVLKFYDGTTWKTVATL